MTRKQYENWKDFALRMARVVYKSSKRPDSKWIAAAVEDFFDRNDDAEWIDGVVDWDETEGSDIYVCDAVAELLDSWGTDMYIAGDSAEERSKNREKAFEQWNEQWGGPVRCCIRAGLDLAASPSAGVMGGATAGQIREMYPGGVPEWIEKDWRDSSGNAVEFDSFADDQSLRL